MKTRIDMHHVGAHTAVVGVDMLLLLLLLQRGSAAAVGNMQQKTVMWKSRISCEDAAGAGETDVGVADTTYDAGVAAAGADADAVVDPLTCALRHCCQSVSCPGSAPVPTLEPMYRHAGTGAVGRDTCL